MPGVTLAANNQLGRWPRRTPSCETRATLATLQHIDTDGYIYTTPSAYFITAISWPIRYDLHWQTRRESASWGECSEVGRIDRRTCLPDAVDLANIWPIGERGSEGGLTDCSDCCTCAVRLYCCTDLRREDASAGSAPRSHYSTKLQPGPPAGPSHMNRSGLASDG